MYKTSEWVSLGHSDKTCDYLSCFILDRFLEKDPMTRYALEVMIKDNHVTLGGEITSKALYSPEDIAAFVRIAVNQVGYTKAYQRIWGKENTICGDDIEVTQYIGRQSPDIAQGVDGNRGWGDQCIAWGMATNTPETGYMPKDHWLAKKIGKHLYDSRYAGIDIKTLVTTRDNRIDDITVAIPMNEHHSEETIADMVAFCCDGVRSYRLHINGTGRFVKHGPIGDCGVTGRKLAVDFYGGNCRLGGGSPWKDGTKADLSLNLLARARALSYIQEHPECPVVFCSISCRIGSPEILVAFYDGQNNELLSYRESVSPEEVIKHFRLREPRFAQMCRNGLFT